MSEENNVPTMAPISVLGATLITRDLLRETKSDEGEDNFFSKINAANKFSLRMMVVAQALMYFGPTEKAAKYIKACQYFSDLTEESLFNLITKVINNISSGENTYVFDPRELGTLDFSNVPNPDIKFPGEDEGFTPPEDNFN